MTPPALPAGITLTPSEAYVLTLLSTGSGVPMSAITGYFANSAPLILTHLQNLGLIVTRTVQTPAGPTVEFYLAP